jgi:hypothetical protein
MLTLKLLCQLKVQRRERTKKPKMTNDYIYASFVVIIIINPIFEK